MSETVNVETMLPVRMGESWRERGAALLKARAWLLSNCDLSEDRDAAAVLDAIDLALRRPVTAGEPR